MKPLVIAAVGALLAATAPAALAQQNQSTIGNVLEQIGHSLNGQSTASAPRTPSQYQQTYDQSAAQYRNESTQQLEQDQSRLDAAENNLRAARQALAAEEQRRGISGGLSGSSEPPQGYNPNYNPPPRNGYAPPSGNYQAPDQRR